MASEKEEGELSDGEIDEEVERQTAEMGDADNLPEPAVPRPHSAPATAPSIHAYRESRENVANNSDFDSSDSNSGSDSDTDNRSWKRQRTIPGMPQGRPQTHEKVAKPVLTSSRMQTTSDVRREPQQMEHDLTRGQQPSGNTKPSVGTKPKKRKNNIWGEIITQQTAERVEKQMTEFDMDTETDRDVESYNYRLALEEAPRHKLGMSAARIEMSDEDGQRELKAGLGEDDSDKWLVDKADQEERGNVKDRLGHRNVKDRLGLAAEVEEDKREEEEKLRRREFKFGKRKGAKQRLGKKSDGSPDCPTMKNVTFSDGEHPKEVAGKIAFSLNEQKRHLIMRVVNILGVDKSKELWQLTLDVEESGGMMVMNGTRRRTPGGVFLHMMKTDEDVTKNQVDEIFAEEKKRENKREKEHRKRKRKQINFDRYLAETKAIMDEKRDKESTADMEEVDLDQEGQVELGFMEGSDDSKGANGSASMGDKPTDQMESGDGMTT
ncbi:uncharacterized protein [Amphiura filiformis]|uniref:uncharacterized protein n=1 Tax=Amphiura filiformis TaxID=82378 RepID=UPI003B2255AD